MRRIFAIALCLSAFALQAADLNIATVDMKVIFDDYYKTRVFEKEIDSNADMVYLRALEKEHGDLREKLQQILSRSRSPVLSDDAKKENQNEGIKVAQILREKEGDIQRTKRKLERFKSLERNEIVKQIQSAADTVSKQRKLDLLLDISGETMNGIASVVYSNPKLDVSADILAILNAGHEEEAAALKAEAQARKESASAEKAGAE